MILLVMLLSILPGFAVAVLVARRFGNRSPWRQVLLGTLSFALVLVTVWGLILGTMLAVLLEPWPLSLRQGPDTEHAHACFERFLGEVPSARVSEIYCRDEWGFGGDTIYSIRFAFTEDTVVSRIVHRLGLRPVPAEAIGSLRYLRAPHWWPDRERMEALDEAYHRRGVEILWIDREARAAYFQRADF